MAQPVNHVVIGTRGSALARWQTDHVASLLRSAWPELVVDVKIITTQGDRVLDTPLPLLGGKGVFTAELEAALHNGTIDLAVHSLKDLPTEDPAGLTLGAIPERAAVEDALVSRSGVPFAALLHGATIGTSSRRRAAQLLAARPDLHIADIRGNVDTRLRKAHDPDGTYDAIILAAAGLTRLGLEAEITEALSLDLMLPAPGQGALAVQCRDDAALLELLAPLNHLPTRLSVTAERAFLARLGGGCSLPIAAYATATDRGIELRCRVSAPDGSEQMDFSGTSEATPEAAHELGSQVAAKALNQGVRRLLESLA
jgi:hydroxymethylbilane synthase